MIGIKQIKAPPGVHSVQMGVTQSGMTVSVEGGSFLFGGVDYAFEQTDYIAQTEDHAVGVTGWLVSDGEGNGLLAVDESTVDGSINWAELPYDKKDVLFQFHVPANTTNLDDIDILVRHLVPVEPEPASESEV